MEEKEIIAVIVLLFFFGAIFLAATMVWHLLYPSQKPWAFEPLTFHNVCYAFLGQVHVLMEMGSSTPESTRGCEEASSTAAVYRAQEEVLEAQQAKTKHAWCDAHTKQTMTLKEWQDCQDI